MALNEENWCVSFPSHAFALIFKVIFELSLLCFDV